MSLSTAAVAAFCRRSASEANVPPLAGGLMAAHLKPAALASLRLILWLLSNALGTLLLLGRLALVPGGLLGLPWPRPFAALPSATRQAALLAWTVSPRPPLRAAFKALKSFVVCAYFGQ
eukprot:SM009187S24543  [mRNA]  locus=s9187:32:556:- [translate_table: standard]